MEQFKPWVSRNFQVWPQFKLLRPRKMAIALLSMSVVCLCTDAYASTDGSVALGISVQQSIKGKVLGSDEEALPGAYVKVKGTDKVTITEADGTFAIEANANDVLQVSFIGFTTLEVNIGNQSFIMIRLTEDVTNLEEVVVVGYGSQKREEVTSSIVKVSSEEFVKGSIGNPLQLLQGKVAGLAVTKSSGHPEAGIEILIRGISTLQGNSSPLIIIDGVPGGNINTLRPEDIESINVLKDGSAAAIYGTRGTGGVIIVTTKTGKGFTEPVVEYYGYTTVENMAKYPRMLTATELREYYDEQAAAGFPINNAQSIRDYGSDTDWMKAVTRTAITHSHTLQFKGGSENTSFLGSVGYRDAEGIARTNDFTILSTRMNLNHRSVDDKLNLTLNIQNNNTRGNRFWNNAFNQALYRNPTLPVYDDNGKIFEVDGWDYWNPRGILEQRDELNQQNHFLGSLKGSYEIVDGLEATALLAYQSWKENNAFFDHTDMYTSVARGQNGYANRVFNWNFDQTAEFTLNYGKSFGSHRIDVVGGYSFQQFDGDWMRAENMDFLNNDFLWYNMGSGNWLPQGKARMSSGRWQNRLVAFFSRANYNFDGKYLFSASIRREGSSKFGANNKWGWFPAVSAGWRISEEGFMSASSLVNDLKIRAGYGVTGTVPLNSYESIPRLRQGSRMFYNGQWLIGVVPASNANPNLRWETKKEFNAGLDFSILNSRLGGSIDYYNRISSDLLWNYSVPVPPNLYPSMLTNVGKISNRGVELALNYSSVTRGDLSWSVDFNVAYNENLVKTLSNEYYSREWFNTGWLGAPGVNTFTHRVQEGQPLGNFYGWEFEGFSENGKWIFKDYDGAAGPSEQDKRVIGNGIPKIYSGLTTNIVYKKWDLNVQFRGAFRYSILNAKRMYFENVFMFPLNVYKSALDLPLNDDPKFSDYYVENGNHVRIDNVTLGYNARFRNVKLKSARFYVSGLNLITLTGYKGLDPEVSATGLTPGIENRWDYPRTRQFTLGVNLSL
jgi:TonB-linked SusC/RagA family outer membrane protein